MQPKDIHFNRRVILVISALICCIGTAGIIFGFASLKPVLVDAGVYGYLCQHSKAPCVEQNVRLSLMFTIASSSTNISALLIGYILDKYGPRLTMILGSVLFGSANLLFALAYIFSIDLYILAFTLFAIGGPFIFLSTLHISCALPKYSNLIMAALSCAFDISTLVFLVFNKIYFGTDGKFGISHFFLSYLAIPVFALIVALIVMPSESFVREIVDVDESEQSQDSSSAGLLKRTHSLDSVYGLDTGIIAVESKNVAISEMSLKDQLTSKEFMLLLLFMCLFMLRFNFFIGSLQDFLLSISKSKDQTDTALFAFGIILPIGPLIAIFLTTWLMNKSFETSYWVLVGMHVIFSVINLIPDIQVQYVGFLFFVLLRSMLYTFANQFCAKTFGFRTFGTVYGVLMLLSGIFNLSQYILTYFALQVLDGSFVYPNLIIILLCIFVATAFPIYLSKIKPLDPLY